MDKYDEMVRSNNIHWILLASCFTFLEVLAPFAGLTGTVGIPLFFIGFCCFSLLQLWKRSLIKQFPLCLPLIYCLLNMLFYSSFFLRDPRWFYQIFLDLSQELANWQWTAMFSLDYLPHIRSFFFFLLLWLISVGWTRCFFRRTPRLLLFCFSFLFIVLVDFGTDLDVGMAPVRLCLWLLLLSMRLKAERMLAELPQWDRLPARWWRWSWSLLLLLGLFAWLMPKVPSTWELDLTRYLPQGHMAASKQKAGYSRDEVTLGGPLEQDMRIVFRAEMDTPYYWRGESKEIYTGNRWVHADGKTPLSLEHLPASAIFRNLFFNLTTSKQQVRITAAKPMGNILFVPGQLTRLQTVEGKPAFSNGVIIAKGEMVLYQSHVEIESSINWTRVTMATEVPEIDEDQLRQGHWVSPDEKKYIQAHLQLPPNMPKRVLSLAKKVTRDADNWYDKAVAIERYLKWNQTYRYDLSNVPTLPEGRDFVDHFLFDSKVGYCDHFSTAMVVLLRANQIPARWVKGFAPGELSYSAVSHRYQATVRNKDAHSWVEVYFPGVGWLPFEPTPTFTNPTAKEREQATNRIADGEKPQNTPATPGLPSPTNNQLSLFEEDNSTHDPSHPFGTKGQGRWLWPGLLLLVMGAAGAVWWKRRFFLWIACLLCLRMGWLMVGYRLYGRLNQEWSDQTGLTLRQGWERKMGIDPQVDQGVKLLIHWYEQRRYGANEEGQAIPLTWRSLWKIMVNRLQP
ncbi:transglutaminase-like domain-containing protein [Laceyella putida]|uniref:Transglutaminase family protein n=1 Tax=Laceyella putida TaxID=110101 RepID=A0ABW2RKN7_9BACL